MTTIAIIVICILAGALSIKSLVALGTAAPWTSAGWGLTVVYLVGAVAKAAWGTVVPGHADYIALALLTIAFVIAGVRDERQAEPWWWPTHRGPRRAEKRGST